MIFCFQTASGEIPWAVHTTIYNFHGLTKAFDLVSRSGLFQWLERTISCHPGFLSLIRSFNDRIQAVVQWVVTSEKVSKWRDAYLPPTLLGIFFSLLLQSAFGEDRHGCAIPSQIRWWFVQLVADAYQDQSMPVENLRVSVYRCQPWLPIARLNSHCCITPFHESATILGVTFSLKRSLIMAQWSDQSPEIQINAQT